VLLLGVILQTIYLCARLQFHPQWVCTCHGICPWRITTRPPDVEEPEREPEARGEWWGWLPWGWGGGGSGDVAVGEAIVSYTPRILIFKLWINRM